MARYKCAWCGEYLNDIVFEGEIDSHGICKACKAEVDKELDKIREYNNMVKEQKSWKKK